MLIFTLFFSLLLPPPSAAEPDLWNLDELSESDWAALESIAHQQRIRAANELRAKTHKFARRNGGLKEMVEWSRDNLQGAPTDFEFTTHGGLSCRASIRKSEIHCDKP